MQQTNVMDGPMFRIWIAEMKVRGLARSGSACGRALGISSNSVVKMKRKGCDLRTSLACHALLKQIPPYHLR